MDKRRLWWLGLGGLLLPGCMVETREFETLRDQVKVQQRQISELKARQEEQALRVDALNNGFKILGDKAEENARRIDEWDERGAFSGDHRAPVPVAAAPPVTFVAPPPAPPPPQPPPPPPAEPLLLTNKTQPPPEGEVITAGPKAEKLYAGALSLFSQRDYAQATSKFEEFVTTYPDHKLAGNAQYWIGECYYSQKRFREAADEFAKVDKLFPNSPKVPAAMLKRGLSLWESKKPQEAQAVLEKIISKYPQSEEASKAKDRLAHWKQ